MAPVKARCTKGTSILLLAALASTLPGPALAQTAQAAKPSITLEKIMAHPDWIGNPPEDPYWGDDGRAVYYKQKRQGNDQRDLYRLNLEKGEAAAVRDAELGGVDVSGGDLSRDRKWKAYSRKGDLYLKNLETGAIRQITRTSAEETEIRFMTGDQRISFRTGGTFYAYDIATGLVSQLADVRLEDDPAKAKENPPYIEAQEPRLLDIIRERKEKEDAMREADQAEQKADPTRPPLPIYLGKTIEIQRRLMSPSGDWLALVASPKDADDGPSSIMPSYVTRSGNVETREVRPTVGMGKPIAYQVILLDLRNGERYDLDVTGLPGIYDDPLKEIREANEARKKVQEKKDGEKDKKDEKGKDGGQDKEKEKEKEKDKDKKARPLYVAGGAWSRDGKGLVLQFEAQDHKDRWLATVDLKTRKLVPRHRLTDPAWINWDMNDFGWMPDSATLFLLSEETGYSHLYLIDTKDGKTRALTRGKYEVSYPRPDFDGSHVYFRANQGNPGIFEVWRAEVATGKNEQLTKLGGLVDDYVLSPDEQRLLVLESSSLRHDDLYVQDNRPGAEARQITQTVSQDFLAQDWTPPEILPIPSSHVKDPIYTKVYTPKGFDARRAEKYPAVVFVHGAGYTQNSHYGWPYYFREQMFHSLLNQHGYVVIDMDYRASAGYGRDWRTAIYRQMGTPELEDLQDGVAWMVKNRNVDPKRIGVYGGSYGGFMAFMALFRDPDLFAAGAALRPVSDWAHYDHDYTSRILNTPDVDPEAYERSSPIEFAAGLKNPLLICSGMVDDNVFFQDSVRIVQRLIELEKENFETAFYPVESHGFVEPTSWLDEYRRIFKLFEAHVK